MANSVTLSSTKTYKHTHSPTQTVLRVSQSRGAPPAVQATVTTYPVRPEAAGVYINQGCTCLHKQMAQVVVHKVCRSHLVTNIAS
jgi:hypothetical protein